MRIPTATVALVGLLLTSASGQTAPKPRIMADTATIEMWRILEENGMGSPAALRAEARKTLLKEGRIPYRFQRVEIAGVGSTDDTDATLPGMIDKQLKTSHLNEVLPADQRIIDFRSIGRSLIDAWNKVDALLGGDAREAFSDTRGVPSSRSQQIIDQLKDAKINELFAHSWGTEVVYLGIMNGSIIPPKKLVIMGVPESNEEKWRLLAAYTGIEVHVIGFEWDKARMIGDAALTFKSGLPEETAKLQKLWNKQCGARVGTKTACADPDKFVQKNFEYNLHVRPPNVPNDKFIKGNLTALDHEKILYYTYLDSRKLFNRTVAQLEAPYLPLIEAEENRMLAEAMAEARAKIADANAAAREAAEAERLQRPNRLWDELNSPEGRRRLAELKEVNPPPNAQVPPSQAAPVRAVRITNFSTMLPNIRGFAAASCRSPGQAPLTEDITRPFENIRFSNGVDEGEIERLSAGLGQCELLLFRKLIEVIRQGRGRHVTTQWVELTAKSYTPAPIQENRSYVPPQAEKPREPGCYPESGVWGCPK